MFHSQVSELTALDKAGARVLIGVVQLPQGGKKLIGVFATAVGGGTQTSGETVSGILELESADMSLQPLQLPLDIMACLTEGMAALKPTIIPVDLPYQGQPNVKGYITLDMAITGDLTGRFGLITE